MATVVFLHGVGGSTPGWDVALTRNLADTAGIAEIECVEIGFDDLIGRSGAIRRHSVAEQPVSYPDRLDLQTQRQLYYQRQIELRTVIAQSPDRVGAPGRKPHPLIPGELMVRFPFLSMRQAGHYRHDGDVRTQVLDRVEQRLAAIDGPVTLLAHSLGSVVALDALHLRNITVDLLVSFGSPLGVRDFWGKQWQQSPTFPYGRVGGWLNIVNVNDPVTWKRGANDRFPQALDAFVRVGDGLMGPMNFHDASTYTSTQTLARAVATACG
ncbi:MAG: hypothetical protein WC054_02500 [Candidatus Nanopelagicales bacterium]